MLSSPITYVLLMYLPALLLSIMVVYSTLISLTFASVSDKMIILGDFNFPDTDWDTLSGNSPVSNHFVT